MVLGTTWVSLADFIGSMYVVITKIKFSSFSSFFPDRKKEKLLKILAFQFFTLNWNPSKLAKQLGFYI